METNNKCKCEECVDDGASRVRGFHNNHPCGRPAKYKATTPDGRVTYLCGIHARSWRTTCYGDVLIEKL